MSHAAVLLSAGVIVVATVAAVLELVTVALFAARAGVHLFVRMVRAAVQGRRRRASGLATAPVVEGWSGVVAPGPGASVLTSPLGGRAGLGFPGGA